MRSIPLAVIGLVLIAGCGTAASTSSPSAPASRTPPPSSAVPASAVPASTAPPVYSDAQACQAFHDAITTGIPAADLATMNVNQMNTLDWLQSQEGNADPNLVNLINNFVTTWGDPADLTGIHQAQAAVTAWCRTHQESQ
jgi:hypothetical protein